MIETSKSGILLFGITPPKQSTPPERVLEIAQKTISRINSLDIDGLVLYDINDESDRNAEERPFPYLPTLDPYDYYLNHLAGNIYPPVIIYRCVGKYSGDDLTSWVKTVNSDHVMSVFVGAASRTQKVATTLKQAYEIRNAQRQDLLLGGVLIAERHTHANNEHLRLHGKRTQGCSFFISQYIYNVDYTKSLLSDYHYYCKAAGLTMPPIILTLSVCGSLKTLEFMKWLGINIPKWLENEIIYSPDPLAESYTQCIHIAKEISSFCQRLNIPYGFNVESVSIRLAEIEASINLAREIREILKEG